jgi:hypothetical protein
MFNKNDFAKLSKLSLKTGLLVLALSVGACSSSSPAATTGTAGTDGGAGTTGTAGTDGGSSDATDGGDGGALTPEEVYDQLLNAPTTGGVTITRPAPKDYASCM